MSNENPTIEELRDVFREAMRPRRWGWRRTMLAVETVEYIIQREHVFEAIKNLQQVDWQNVMPNNQALGEEIIRNVMHSLAVMSQAMRRIEVDHV